MNKKVLSCYGMMQIMISYDMEWNTSSAKRQYDSNNDSRTII